MKKQLLKTILFFTFLIVTVGADNAQTWSWAKSGDGSGTNEGFAVCTDPSGNILITGALSSTAVNYGSYTLTNAGGMFLVKYDPNGNVLWAKNATGWAH